VGEAEGRALLMGLVALGVQRLANPRLSHLAVLGYVALGLLSWQEPR
jgi:hypothetical protein